MWLLGNTRNAFPPLPDRGGRSGACSSPAAAIECLSPERVWSALFVVHSFLPIVQRAQRQGGGGARALYVDEHSATCFGRSDQQRYFLWV